METIGGTYKIENNMGTATTLKLSLQKFRRDRAEHH